MLLEFAIQRLHYPVQIDIVDLECEKYHQE